MKADRLDESQTQSAASDADQVNTQQIEGPRKLERNSADQSKKKDFKKTDPVEGSLQTQQSEIDHKSQVTLG